MEGRRQHRSLVMGVKVDRLENNYCARDFLVGLAIKNLTYHWKV